MWINPAFAADRPKFEPKGVPIAIIPRGRLDPDGTHWEELRVSLDEYNGHAFISLRVFERASDGQMYPHKTKGCSVRLAECERVAAAILAAGKLADEPGAGRSSRVEPPADEGGTMQGR